MYEELEMKWSVSIFFVLHLCWLYSIESIYDDLQSLAILVNLLKYTLISNMFIHIMMKRWNGAQRFHFLVHILTAPYSHMVALIFVQSIKLLTAVNVYT